MGLTYVVEGTVEYEAGRLLVACSSSEAAEAIVEALRKAKDVDDDRAARLATPDRHSDWTRSPEGLLVPPEQWNGYEATAAVFHALGLCHAAASGLACNVHAHHPYDGYEVTPLPTLGLADTTDLP